MEPKDLLQIIAAAHVANPNVRHTDAFNRYCAEVATTGPGVLGVVIRPSSAGGEIDVIDSQTEWGV